MGSMWVWRTAFVLRKKFYNNKMSIPSRILPTIVVSQFCCTSLWFAGNAVMGDLLVNFQLPDTALGHLTSAVQFGFITGTLVFALLAIADRFSPSRVFVTCAIVGALFNLGTTLDGNNLSGLLGLRFITGFFLAGIYPVGMKIAADYYEAGLGKSLGYLVGALVLGTAFPHLLKGFTTELPWRMVLVITSVLATMGGVLMLLLVPDGPFRKQSQKVDLAAFLKVFQNKKFRKAAFGYFGHMWELYTFWAFVPVMLITYQELFPTSNLNVSFWSFMIIGSGGLSCVIGGYLSQSYGTDRVATTALTLSGICCLVSPLVFYFPSDILFISFLFFWGLVVVADSPLFSTMVAKNAPPENKGTALTIVNCIGFAITIISIQLMVLLQGMVDIRVVYMVLAIGPVTGLLYQRL